MIDDYVCFFFMAGKRDGLGKTRGSINFEVFLQYLASLVVDIILAEAVAVIILAAGMNARRGSSVDCVVILWRHVCLVFVVVILSVAVILLSVLYCLCVFSRLDDVFSTPRVYVCCICLYLSLQRGDWVLSSGCTDHVEENNIQTI